MKRVLMVAYHFPPLAGSSGIQRTLRFVQQLPAFGWQPMVLSASAWVYERTSNDLDAAVPPSTVVRRAFALDAARHLSIGGRYWSALARPDRWTSWRFDAVRQGLQMIREFKPEVIWSTYPIATAHRIGAALQRRSGLPWVADFRDPMAQEGYPADPSTRRQFQAIERLAIKQAACCMFTTPSAADTYRNRYPEAAARIAVLENGYDEDSFAAAERLLGPTPGRLNEGSVTLLHSGIVYPDERDPTQLFVALARIKQAAAAGVPPLKVRFRAPQHHGMLEAMARTYGVQDQVEICPPIGYQEALVEMLRADALLLMQASNCNEQIPAKLYEYMRARRPILCLSDPQGDTVACLREAGGANVAALDSPDAIAALLQGWLAGKVCALPDENAVVKASRLGRTETLAACLQGLANEPRLNVARLAQTAAG